MHPLDEAAASFRDARPALFVNEIRDVGVVGVPIAVASSEIINFLVTACRGMVYVALPQTRLEELAIAPQPYTGSGPDHLYVPVDALAPVTTGISAADRAETVHRLIDPAMGPADFRQPGHVTPMALHLGGVLDRLGLAEAAHEVASQAGFDPGVVFCGVLTEDGHMAGVADLAGFAEEHDLVTVTVADAVRGRRRISGWERPARSELDLSYADWRAQVRAQESGQVLDSVEVMVVPSCVAGHVLGDCQCTGSGDLAREWVEQEGARALVATSPAGRIPSCQATLPEQVVRGLAALVAADHFGARVELVDASSL